MQDSPYILCIETSTNVCSVVVSLGLKCLSQRHVDDYHSHSTHLTLFIEECLHEAGISYNQLNAVAISSGPGSYTGLRIGASVAKGICFGKDIPLISLPSLDILIDQCRTIDSGVGALGVIDARREEVYLKWVGKDGNIIVDTCSKVLTDPFILINQSGKVFAAGSGASKLKKYYPDLVNVISEECNARYMIPLAVRAFLSKNFSHIITFSPFYLKNPNITLSKKNVLS